MAHLQGWWPSPAAERGTLEHRAMPDLTSKRLLGCARNAGREPNEDPAPDGNELCVLPWRG